MQWSGSEWALLGLGLTLLLLVGAWAVGLRRLHAGGRRLLARIAESTSDPIHQPPARRHTFGRILDLPALLGFRLHRSDRANAATGSSMQMVIVPSRPPFVQIELRYHPPLSLDFWAVGLALVGRVAGRLEIHARFEEPPRSEIFWLRGDHPRRHLDRTPDPEAGRQRRPRRTWIYRELSLGQSAYAVRGIHSDSLIWAFTECQARFSPAFRRLHISREKETSHLDMSVTVHTLPGEKVPHLLAAVWTLGRAAHE